MRVLLTGGGTGGHVYPALAIADIIKEKDPQAEIAFVGTKKGIENKLVCAAGYKLYHVEISGIRRSLSPKNIKTAYLILTSPYKAKKIIKEFSPDIVIGTGGYVSWPLLRAAADMGIPSMIHESNAYPGLAVRKLQKFVDVTLTNFEETAERLDKTGKIVNVGNPMRVKRLKTDNSEAKKALGIDENAFTVLSFGGSLGAEAVNNAMLSVMKDFSAKNENTVHLHAWGSAYYEEYSSKAAEAGINGENIRLSEYIYDMPLYMAAADAVICRAGAMTLSELSVMEKPAVLIPSPNVTDDHQYKNAKVAADRGGAYLVRESENMSEEIITCLKKLSGDSELRRSMGRKMGTLAKLDAGDAIYNEIVRLVTVNGKIKKRKR